MNENTVTNADVVAAFRNSLNYLWDGKAKANGNTSRYICFSLNRVEGNMYWLRRGCIAAKLIVLKRIYPSSSVEDFLRRRVSGFSIVNTPEHDIAVQAHRIAWVNMLVDEYAALPQDQLAVIR